jgi:hypothetical protein
VKAVLGISRSVVLALVGLGMLVAGCMGYAAGYWNGKRATALSFEQSCEAFEQGVNRQAAATMIGRHMTNGFQALHLPVSGRDAEVVAQVLAHLKREANQ